MKQVFNSQTFAELMKWNPEEAFKYVEKMSSTYSAIDDSQTIPTLQEVPLKHEIDTTNMSVEEMKEELTKRGIRFHHLAWENKLRELLSK